MHQMPQLLQSIKVAISGPPCSVHGEDTSTHAHYPVFDINLPQLLQSEASLKKGTTKRREQWRGGSCKTRTPLPSNPQQSEAPLNSTCTVWKKKQKKVVRVDFNAEKDTKPFLLGPQRADRHQAGPTSKLLSPDPPQTNATPTIP